MTKLTDLQRSFVDQYFICGKNGTEAVIAAGYKVKNRQTAAAIASENLRKPHVRGEIDKRLEENTLKANEVLQMLSDQAMGSMGAFLDERGQLSMDKAAAREKRHLIKRYRRRKVVQAETTVIEEDIELYDAQSALVQLGRYYKLFTDRVEVTDWQTEAVMAIRSGEIDYPALAEEFGDDLATQLFREAGVHVETAG